MKPIRIFSPQLEFLTEIDNYESLIFTRRWHKPGEFTMHINRHKQGTEYLQKGNIVMLSPTKAGIIRHREIVLGPEGKGSEQITIIGHTLQGIAGQRIIVPPEGQSHDIKSGPAETVIKHYASNCMINPTNPARKIPLVIMATDQGRGPSISWQSRYKNLAEELEKISLLTGLGWNVYLDLQTMQWVFEVYEGRNLTAGQDENPPVIFSPDFDNIETQKYVESDIDRKSLAYVGGQGEGVDRTIVTVPELPWDEPVEYVHSDSTKADFEAGDLDGVVATDDGVELYQYEGLRFDGVDDYVDCGNDSSLNITDAITLEAWVKPESFGDGVLSNDLISKGTTFGGNQAYSLSVFRDGRVWFEINSQGVRYHISKNIGAELNGKWTHIAGVYNGEEMVLYVNGEEQASSEMSYQTIDIVSAPVRISAPNRFFDGMINEVRIWSIARTQQQIQDAMNKELIGNETGLVSYWKLNEGTGTTAYDSAGNNDGTIYGATWFAEYEPQGTLTKEIDISTEAEVETTKIEWTSTEPEDTSITIETALSLDGGENYGEWQTATNGGPIPGITGETDLSNARLKYRATLETTDTSTTPKLHLIINTIDGVIHHEGDVVTEGLELHETFVDARDISNPADLLDRGRQHITDETRHLEGDILTHGSFKYEKDWDLGDIVTIQNKDWGVTMDARVTEVTEVYEPSGYRLSAILGDSMPKLTDKIKKELEQISAEVRR